MARRFHLACGGLLGAALAALAMPAPQAAAQQLGNDMRSASARPVVPIANAPANRREAAPGLPGASADPDRVAPADRPASEMRPTEALFDAINRGDISAARDALARGAEVNGRNVLGVTPVELAVDLGRKDIAFLLLSLRGMDDRPAPRPGPARMRPGEAQAMFDALERGEQPGRGVPRQEARRPTPQPQAIREPIREPARAPAPAPQAPKLFAGDGGNPSPEAGFLGFDGGRGTQRQR
jgi:ankyrin repeat protein